MTTQEFAMKLTADNQALVDKMQACKAPEEAYDIAKAAGLTDTFQTFTAEMTKMYNAAKDLSDDDLQNVAGGATDAEAVSITVTTAVSAASIIGGIAAVAAVV